MRRTAYRLNAPTRETYLLWQVPQTVLLAHAKYEVGIREQSPDSRSSLAILPMYDPEVADLVGRRRYGSVHCRGGGRLESTTGPLHMWPSPATSSEILGSNPRPSDERPRYLPGKQGHTFDRFYI